MALAKILYLILIVIISCIHSDTFFDYDEHYSYFDASFEDLEYFKENNPPKNSSLYLTIPEVKLTDTVKLQRYPLQINGESIQTMLSRLGIKEISELYLAIVQNTSSDSSKRQHLADDLFNDLRNLTLLDLNNNHVHLSLNIFKPLEKMEVLRLGNTSLEFLEPGIFKYQKNLKQLHLFDNKLQNLTKQSFSGAESLEELDLSACNIKTFVPDIFSNLINLKSINLNLNYFTSLPSKLFIKNKKLHNFQLSDNRGNLATLPSRMLANLRELRQVYINAGLKTIDRSLFIGSTQIELIDLQQNKFKTLPSDIFHGLRNLHTLDLCNNELIQLSDTQFETILNLQELRLSYNNLTGFSSFNKNYLYRLETYSSIRSYLRKPGYQASYTHLHKVVRINLVLQHLNLSHNKIAVIESDLILLNKRLKTLDLSYNNISYISSKDLKLFHTRNLQVNLSHNVIKEIIFDDKFRNASHTNTHINLNYNPIDCNCWIYDFLTCIKKFKNTKNPFKMDKLYCNKPENMINRQIETIEPTEFLCLLDSPNTNETLCPPGCNCQKRIYDSTFILNCSNANLSYVPQIPILNEIKSVEFYLDNNNLIALPSIHNDTNIGYKLVTILNLANNKLRNIQPENIPNNLRLLNLTNNQLTSMNQSVLNKLKKYVNNSEDLYLSGNPWICDCTTIDFLTFCKEQMSKDNDFLMIQCQNDGKYLIDKDVNDFCRPPISLNIIFGSSFAIFGLLIGIMIALYYKYKIEIKIWVFDKKLFTQWVNEYDVDVNMIYDAFVSYSHLDQEFVIKYILPELELGTPKYKLCLHERDWKIGNTITQSIADSVAYSRRTIIILSSNFIDSDWAKLEFRAAYDKSMAEKRSRLIVILYGEKEIDKNKLDNELKAYLNTNTYIKWGDKWFWKRLRYALPHPNGHRLQPPNGL